MPRHLATGIADTATFLFPRTALTKKMRRASTTQKILNFEVLQDVRER
jgi:hypothetical protein